MTVPFPPAPGLVQRTVTLRAFPRGDLDRGRGTFIEVLWWLCKLSIVQSAFPWPSPVRAAVLRLFGAKVGQRLYMRPGVNVHFPWKLDLGDDVWIGERCTLLNLEPITIRSNTALGHEVYLAAGGHDIRSPVFAYDNRPIVLESGVWVGTRAYIGAGVTVGEGSVVAAAAVVVSDVPAGTVVAGVPGKVIGPRILRDGAR